MKIEVRGIINNGIYNSEKIVLDVLEDCNIGNYLISTAQSKTKDSRNSYRFPIKELKKGDIIVLHTQGGEDKVVKTIKESTYEFHWNRGYCVRDYTRIFLMRYITETTMEIR